MTVCRHILKKKNTLKFSLQVPRQMGLGRAGVSGRPVPQGERLGQEPAIILHPMVAEQPVWAPPLRLTAVRVTFPLEVPIQNNVLSVFCSFC